MPSLDYAMTRHYLASGYAGITTDESIPDTGPVAIRLRWVCTDTTVTAQQVAVNGATDLVTSYKNSAGTYTTDTFAPASYSSIGSVVDAINAKGKYEAKILDSLRGETASTTYVKAYFAKYTRDGHDCWDVLQNVGDTNYIAHCMSFDRGFFKDHKTTHRVTLQELKYFGRNISIDGLYIYERKGNSTETLLYKATAANETATTINFDNSKFTGRGITATDGNDLIVKLKGYTTEMTDAYVMVAGTIE